MSPFCFSVAEALFRRDDVQHRLYDNVCDFCVFCCNRFARNLTDLFQITHNILLKDLFKSVLFLSGGHCGLSELPFDFALWAKIKDQCSRLLSISVAERSRSKPKQAEVPLLFA